MVTLTLSDVTGKTVWKHFGAYETGLNNVTIDVDDLNTSGVLYYRLEAEDHSASMKMIILK